MHATFRKTLCFTLALFLASTPLTRAQQKSTSTPAPIPPQIASAHTVFVSYGGGADRAYSQLYAGLQQWGRYQIVDSPSQADLLFEIKAIDPAISTGIDGSVVYYPQLILRILDSKTNALLWTTTANIKAAGGQKSRDKGFDESVAVLVDRVRQLTGEQLNPTQVKAVRSNSQMPTSKKVLIGIAIGAFVGITIFGIYKVTHRNTPTLQFLPAPIHPSVLFLRSRRRLVIAPKQAAAHYTK
jgi:hypothetical protein